MSPLLGRPSLQGSHLVRRALLLGVAIVIASAPLSILLAGSSWLLIPLMACAVVIGSGTLLRTLLRSSVLVPVLQLVVIAGLLLAVQRMQGVADSGGGLGELIGAQPGIIVTGLQELTGALPPVVLQPHGAVVVLLMICLVVLGLDLMFLDLGWHTPTALLLMGFILAPALQQPSGGQWWTALGPVLAGLLIFSARTVHGDPAYLEGDQRPQAGPLRRRERVIAAVAAATLLVAGLTLPLSAALPQTAPPRIPLSMDLVNQWQGTQTPQLGPVMIDDSVSVRQELLRGEEREVLRYTTTDETPSYLRLTTLPRYDDGDFKAGPGMPWDPQAETPAFSNLTLDRMPVDPATEQLAEHTITLQDLGGPRAPLPDNVRGLDTGTLDTAEVSIGDPGAVVVDTAGIIGTPYTVLSEERRTTPEQLRAMPIEQLQGPFEQGVVSGEVPQVAADLAEQLATDAGAENAYDTAVAYQEHFRTSYAYSLTVRTPPGADPLQTFLDNRIGYCEQFAAAFALMMNSQGYPTRVVIGFTAGMRDGEEWVVTSHNAHAWPEVWFGPEHGWVPFEPTPAAAANGVNPPDHTDPDTVPEGEDQVEEPTAGEVTPEAPTPGEPTAPTPTTGEETDDAGDTGGQGTEGAAGGGVQPWGVLAVVLLVGALAGAVLWLGRRRTAALEGRWQAAADDGPQALASRAWSELEQAVQARQQRIRWLGWSSWYGRPPVQLHLDAALPPNEALASLLAQAREGRIPVEDRHEQAAERLGRAVHQARYAPGGAVAADAGGASPAGARADAGARAGADTGTAGTGPAGGALREDVDTLTELLTRAPRRSS